MRLVLVWFLNTLALLAVAYLMPSVHIQSFGTALVAPSSALYPTSLSDATVTCSVPCPADVNGDGSVTPADIALVARAMHATSGSPRWNPATDIDGDGLTTQRDLLAVIRARRECGGSVR